jgi:outer membrane protein assembly factor BamB
MQKWNTGKKMWEEHCNNKGSIISDEGLLYIYDEKGGNVGLLKANPEKFDLVSSFKVTQAIQDHSGHTLLFTMEYFI